MLNLRAPNDNPGDTNANDVIRSLAGQGSWANVIAICWIHFVHHDSPWNLEIVQYRLPRWHLLLHKWRPCFGVLRFTAAACGIDVFINTLSRSHLQTTNFAFTWSSFFSSINKIKRTCQLGTQTTPNEFLH